MKRLVVVFSFVGLLVLPVLGQTKQWTLTECIERALQENISINQRRLTNKSAELTLEQSKATRIPTLSGSTSQGFNFGRSLDPYTNTYVAQNIASSSFGLNSTLSLFNGFQTVNSIKKNELDLKAGTLDLEKNMKDVTLNITLAYLQILFAYEQVENAKIQLESTQSQVEKTQKMVNSGTLPIGNLYAIESQMSTDKYSLVNAQNQLSISKVNMMQMMELPADPSFDIYRPDMSEFGVEVLPAGTPDNIYAKALELQPEIESSEIKVASAETNLKISKGSLYPRLSLNAGINSAYSDQRLRTFPEQLNDNLSQSIRFNLSIPIFNQKQTITQIQKSEIIVSSTQLNALETRNQLRKSIEQAYNDMVAAQHNYEAVQGQLVTSETSFRDSNRKYELGMITATDFLIAKNNFETAHTNLTRAKYNYLFMSKILDFYEGNPIEL